MHADFWRLKNRYFIGVQAVSRKAVVYVIGSTNKHSAQTLGTSSLVGLEDFEINGSERLELKVLSDSRVLRVTSAVQRFTSPSSHPGVLLSFDPHR
jgi:hypothetical protein